MSSMQAAYLVEPGQFEVRDVPIPVPGPDEVLLRVTTTGICGTDIHIFHTQGRGADVVFESVGDAALYRQALKLMRKGGHLAAFGLTGIDDALTMLVHSRIKTDAFTGASYALKDIQSAFDRVADCPMDLKSQIVMTRSRRCRHEH